MTAGEHRTLTICLIAQTWPRPVQEVTLFWQMTRRPNVAEYWNETIKLLVQPDMEEEELLHYPLTNYTM